MPIAATVSGTLTRTAAGGSAAAGTLSVIGYSANPAAGTLAVDRTLFLAFYSRVRLCRPDVTIAGELMANLVDTVEIDDSIDDPISYATFTLSDKRVAFFDPATLSNGERAVAIDLWAGPPGNVLKWTGAFVGNTESSGNTMPYRPRGVFKAVNLAAKWADLQGCLNVPAMSGLTRGEILAAFAESAGVVIANAATLGGAIVTKKIDIAGKTPFDLIKEFGEIEGWIARVTDDGAGLEIIDEDRVLDWAPVFSFDESNYFDVTETTPNRPVTDWILSTTQIVLPALASGGGYTPITTVSESSNSLGEKIVTTITTQAGAEIKKIVESWAIVVRPGIVLLGPALQLVSRVTTETTFAPFAGNPGMLSAQMTSRTTTTESIAGRPAAVSGGLYGSGIVTGYDWAQGGRYSDPYAVVMPTETVHESFTYGDCFLQKSDKTVYGWYSPLSDPADTYVYLYSDGTYRHDAYYGFYIIGEDSTVWFDIQKTDLQNPTFDTFTSTSNYHVTGKATSPNETLDVEGYGPVSGSANQPALVPVSITGSTSIPQVSEEIIMVEYDATAASGYTKITSSPGTLPYPENADELNAIAKRRIRRAHSVPYDITHNCIPYLRVGDHVELSNNARSLVNADAYVTATKRTGNVLNGAMRQVTTLKIPPSWI